MGEKVSRAERAREQQRVDARQQAKPQPKQKEKPQESDFNRALEKSQLSSKTSPQLRGESKVATERAIKEAMHQQDRRGDDRKRDEDDREKGRDGRQKGDAQNAKLADQKVIAKGRLKQQSGGGGQGQGRGFGQTLGRKSMARALKQSGARGLPVNLQGKFAAKLAQQMKGADAAQQTQFTQQILNQLVQYVRIGLNRKGEEEIQIELHEKIFRGLKLRVTAREGKVAVQFRTADKEGRRVLTENTDTLKAALSEKGIAVDEIAVT